MSIAIIDSGGANITSVVYALRRLGAEPRFTSDARVVSAAERVILPGVGAAGAGMARLRELSLVDCIRSLRQPVLGICLGMQLLFERSSEDETDCLGVVPGRLDRMPVSGGVRVPHMGWNTIEALGPDPLLDGLPESAWFYFVHSYCAPVGPGTLAACTHGERFTAVVGHANFRGVQFHPERSAADGARVLSNFLEMSCN